jgi:predicted dehydrogenase
MKKIKWGIIGCGDVTELKSGPAFNKVKNSELIAVMRRDAVKAQDYALRHHVPKWYSDADELINDPEVNAIYVATPPSSHAQYAIASILAGKDVYIEKPMALNAVEAEKISSLAKEKNVKIVVAHYRREHPLFKKVKQLISEKVIGEIRFVNMEFFRKPLKTNGVDLTQSVWRVNPQISGGGIFHDIAPHQLDLMCFFFGEINRINGISINQAGLYVADDLVTGNILFNSGVVFNGLWCFTVPEHAEKDFCEIIGSDGKIEFSIFEGNTIKIITEEKEEVLRFDPIQHVQQPMIQKVVEYFLDEAENPCKGDEGVQVMKIMDALTANH